MKIPGIKEFPEDEKIWRIDWIGGVSFNPSVPSEPLIDVIISPLVEEETDKDTLSNTSVLHAERRVLKIGVGQFPVMEIGSLWKNGVPFSRKTETKKLENLLIDETTVRVVRTDHQENDEWLISPHYHRVGKSGFSAKCVCIENDGDPFGIIIPAAELIRFYYAVSTDMALVLFSGTFRHNPNFIVGKNSGYDADKKLYFLELRKYFSDEDGWVIARILHSPEANHGAMQVHDSLMRDSTAGCSMAPESTFPFSGKTTLVFRGKRIQSFGKKWRWLVYSLVRCSAKFPFEDLKIDRDNPGGGGKPGTDLPDEEIETVYFSKKGDLPQELEDQKIQSENEPDADIKRFQVSLPSERFTAIAGKKILKPERGRCLYKSGRVPGFKKIDIKAFGTGRGGYANTEIAPLSLNVQLSHHKALHASFENFIQMIECLATYPDVQASIRNSCEHTEFLPLLKFSRCSQWSYLNSSLKIRRGVIMADVIWNERQFTLIELQRRKHDAFNTCLLSAQDGSKIPDLQICEILKKVTEKNGRWENIKELPQGVRKISIRHTQENIKEFAANVLLRLQQFSASCEKDRSHIQYLDRRSFAASTHALPNERPYIPN